MQDTAYFDSEAGQLSLHTSTTYLLITATAAEVSSLAAVAEAHWGARHSLRVGQALGHPVFWCAGEQPDEVTVLVGSDDETWELSLVVPLTAVLAAVRQAGGKCR